MSDSKQSSPDKNFNKIVAFVCIAIIAVVGVTVLLRGDSAAPSSNDAEQGVSMYLTPKSQEVDPGSEISISVWANSGDKTVNSVEADLTYPTSALEFVSVDGANSSFALAVDGSGDNGSVKIARGSTTPLKGNLLVAVVKLQAKKTGEAKVKFADTTQLFSSTTNKDILAKKVSATYTIK